MKNIFLLIIALGFCNISYAKPIGNKNTFFKGIEQCIKSDSSDKCLTKHLSNHIPPGNESMKQQLPQVAGLFVQWLGNDTVFGIHPVKTQKVGEIVDIRHYAIEARNGGFMVMKVKYIKILGKDYLFGFNLSSTDEVVGALLSGKL